MGKIDKNVISLTPLISNTPTMIFSLTGKRLRLRADYYVVAAWRMHRVMTIQKL